MTTPPALRLTCAVPIRLVSESNKREHWAPKSKRVKSHRAAVTLTLDATFGRKCGAALLAEESARVVVMLTRVAPRKLDKHDNLRASAKGSVDAIAAWLRVDDADPRIEWAYTQESGKPREYGLKIEIVAAMGEKKARSA